MDQFKLKIYEHDKDDSLLKTFTNYIRREEESRKQNQTDQEKVDRPQSGTLYKISCTNCSFVCYGQTARSLKTRITEHKSAVSMFDHDSQISCHVHENNHEMDFGSVRVAGHEANFHERLFLKAWFSRKDPQFGNDHIVIPEVCK